MDASITDLAKVTLEHGKELIKEMDAAGFSYDRVQAIQLLSSLTSFHNQENKQGVVASMERTIAAFENIEHAYHEWQYANENGALAKDMQSLLGGFKTTTIETNAKPSWWSSVHIVGPMYRVVGRIELLGIVMLLALGSLLLFGAGPHIAWYLTIRCSIGTLSMLLIQWLYSWQGRLAVCFLIGCLFWWFV